MTPTPSEDGHDAVGRVPVMSAPVLGSPAGPRPAAPPLRWRIPVALVAPAAVVVILAALVLTALAWAAAERALRQPPPVIVLEPDDTPRFLAGMLAPLVSVPLLLLVCLSAAILGAGAVWCARRPSPLRTSATVATATVVPVLVAGVVIPVLAGQGLGSIDDYLVLFAAIFVACGVPVVLAMLLVLHRAGVTVRSRGAYPSQPAG